MNSGNHEIYLNFQKGLEFVGDSSDYQKRLSSLFLLHHLLTGFFIMGLPLLTLPNHYLCSVENETFVCDGYQAQFN